MRSPLLDMPTRELLPTDESHPLLDDETPRMCAYRRHHEPQPRMHHGARSDATHLYLVIHGHRTPPGSIVPVCAGWAAFVTAGGRVLCLQCGEHMTMREYGVIVSDL